MKKKEAGRIYHELFVLGHLIRFLNKEDNGKKCSNVKKYNDMCHTLALSISWAKSCLRKKTYTGFEDKLKKAKAVYAKAEKLFR